LKPGRRVAYVAADQGPREALEALAARVPGTPYLKADIQLLVCGTSDSAGGREIEASARLAASRSGIPCIVVEDFAGNYVHVPGAEPRLVVVDGDLGARLARAQEPALDVRIFPNLRYDQLRLRLGELRNSPTPTENAVLWVGQPEADDGLKTLHRLLPALATRSVQVWLRAHPRDLGYGRGAYAELDVEDVTALPLEECLARRPRLVVTQFSSVAIEAGFWDIPSLNVLFPDAGGRTLAAKKGYSVPPWCEEGAAFLLVEPRKIGNVLDRALGSTEARTSVMQAFDRYFKVGEEGAPALINLLYNQGLL
jgi:hypothetical protein